MISSMTGYGEVHRSVDGVAYALETKSVNNRYLKPIIKLPEGATEDVAAQIEGTVLSALRILYVEGAAILL